MNVVLRVVVFSRLQIPADVRILECSDNMVVDNAPLTGESEPQKRKNICTHQDPMETQVRMFRPLPALRGGSVRRTRPWAATEEGVLEALYSLVLTRARYQLLHG